MSVDAKVWVTAVAVTLLAGGCSNNALPPAQSLGLPHARFFSGGPHAFVTSGSAGEESIEAGSSLWWFNAKSGTISVRNSTSRSEQITVSAEVLAPCPSPATVTFRSRQTMASVVTTKGASAPLTMTLDTRPHGSRRISVSIVATPCQPSGDTRLLYAGVSGLAASTP